MRSTSQFTTPAYIGSAVAVIMTSVFRSFDLPPAMQEPGVIAAVVGLTSAMASSIASYVNAVVRERRRKSEKEETE